MKEINVKEWSKGNLTRFYLTDEEGNDLGYVQEKQVSRGTGYYNEHRKAKGDMFDFETFHTVCDEVFQHISYTNVTNHRVIDFPLLRSSSGGRTYVAAKRKIVNKPAVPIKVNA